MMRCSNPIRLVGTAFSLPNSGYRLLDSASVSARESWRGELGESQRIVGRAELAPPLAPELNASTPSQRPIWI